VREVFGCAWLTCVSLVREGVDEKHFGEERGWWFELLLSVKDREIRVKG